MAMMGAVTTAHPTPAGWYPDPESAERLRYWDGRNWTSDTHDPAAPLPVPAAQTFWVPASSPSLSMTVRVLLAVTGVACLVNAGVEIWGFRLLADAARDPTSLDLGLLDRYDQLHVIGAWINAACVLITGVTWIVWQARLASHAPRLALRRSPGWHTAGWFVPVVSLWFPVQNLADLRGALTGARSPSRIPVDYLAWWLAWLGGSTAAIISAQLSLRGANLSIFADSVAMEAASDLLRVLAAGLAILVVRDINSVVRAILNPGDASPTSRTAIGQG